LPILDVSIFRYIGHHFEARHASTVYMAGVSFGHSLGLAILSPLAGVGYDLLGFRNTYFLIAAMAVVFWIASWFTLSSTPPEVGPASPAIEPPIAGPLDPSGSADVLPLGSAGR
jgi:OHS family lactose permease-like MFS transporter